MSKIIAISNQKGGVGKTTTSINFAAALGAMNKKILLVDFDSQANATIGIGVKRKSFSGKDLFEFLTNDDLTTKDVAIKNIIPNVDIIPSSINLAGLDIQLFNQENKEHIFRDKIFHDKSQYDYIILDCPPSLGTANTIALSAADSVLVPIQAEHYALEGIKQLFSTIRLVQRLFNKKLKIEGIVLTMYDVRTNLSREVKELADKTFEKKSLKTFIPRNVKLAEAPAYGKSIFDYDKNCEGAISYKKLAKEIVKNNGK